MTTRHCSYTFALAATLTLLLGGCIEASVPTGVVATTGVGAPTPLETRSALPDATLTPAPTIETASPTVATATISPTPFPELVSFLELPLAHYPVLSPSSDPSCQLPCWQGLRPGESTLDDVQEVFDDIFQFGGRVRLADLLDEGMPLSADIVPGVYHINLLWQFDESREDAGAFSVKTVFDEARALQGIRIYQFPQGEHPSESAQQMIQTLGRPNHIQVFVGWEGGETVERAGVLTLYLIYTRGISVRLFYRQIFSAAEPISYPSLCFTEPPHMSFTDLVTAFDLSGEPETIAQREWIFEPVSRDGWVTVDEGLGMTIDQFVDFVLQPNPCMDIDYGVTPVR